MEWNRDHNDLNRVRKLELAIENCFMLANRKRCMRHEYKDGEIIPRGPLSDDADWDHIIRFCQSVGVKESILRANAEPEPR